MMYADKVQGVDKSGIHIMGVRRRGNAWGRVGIKPRNGSSTFNAHKASQEEKTEGDACIWVQWGVGTSRNTRQYTIITICSDSKRHRRSAKGSHGVWTQPK